MLKEFRDFVAKGNMLDLAVGIVIGAAFTAIVNSLVKDLITPIIGLFGSQNFDEYKWILKDGTPGVTLNIGSFITAVINFVIVAFVLFMVVKAANRMKRKEEAAEAAPPEVPNQEKLLTEIRDLLKAR